MIRNTYKTNKKISKLFYIIMTIIIVWFIGMQIFGPNEHVFDQSGHSIVYHGAFTWENLMERNKRFLFRAVIKYL